VTAADDATKAAGSAEQRLLLTVEEAARALSIGRSKVYELMRTGELPSVQIGACRRVDVGELARFVERHRAGVA
jgi:excisionase family DNA binding protein